MALKDFDGDNAAIHDEFENIPTNKSGNTPFSEVLADNMSRRAVLSGGLAAAVATFFAAPDLLAKGKGKKKGGRRREWRTRQFCAGHAGAIRRGSRCP